MRVFSFLCGLLVLLQVRSQELPEPRNVSVLSLGGALALRTFLATEDTSVQINRSGTPVIGLSHDVHIKKNLSLGASLAYQHFNLSLRDSTGLQLLESGRVYRAYAGLRALYFLDNYERMDFYCGIKAGVILFRSGEISGPQAFRSDIERTQNGIRPAIGLIPLGFRYHAENNFGFCLESSLGVPTFISAGVFYGF
jgi:hypothetical protein